MEAVDVDALAKDIPEQRRHPARHWRILTRGPWPEVSVMLFLMVITYVGMALLSAHERTPEGGMSAGAILLVLLGFFLLSYAIAVVAVIAGIGGGVIFTPIMLAFTNINSLVVRATGLIVAMFSGLVSSGPFMRQGLGNLKISILLGIPTSAGALMGALGAIVVADKMGPAGEGLVRLSLGIIVIIVGGYFIMGGTKMEWPEVKRVDSFTRRLGLTLPYYEKSLGRLVDYKVTRAWAGVLFFLLVGFLGGFFGMGGGWAAVPGQNLLMGVPLKVASANSGVILGMSSCAGIWPYLFSGAIVALFVAPWLVGQVLGGITGSYLLIRIKAGFVRYILIGLLFFTGFSLATKGLTSLDIIGEVPITANLAVLALLGAGVALAITGKFPNLRQTKERLLPWKRG